jgi:hypothetical protein
VIFAFQTDKPTGRHLIRLLALPLRKTKTAFFNFSQRELPLLMNCTKLCTNPYRHEPPGRYQQRAFEERNAANERMYLRNQTCPACNPKLKSHPLFKVAPAGYAGDGRK